MAKLFSTLAALSMFYFSNADIIATGDYSCLSQLGTYQYPVRTEQSWHQVNSCNGGQCTTTTSTCQDGCATSTSCQDGASATASLCQEGACTTSTQPLCQDGACAVGECNTEPMKQNGECASGICCQYSNGACEQTIYPLPIDIPDPSIVPINCQGSSAETYVPVSTEPAICLGQSICDSPILSCATHIISSAKTACSSGN